MAAKTVIAKIGTSSITDKAGHVSPRAVKRLCEQVAALRADGHRVVVVTSGAITAGLPAIGMEDTRPKDTLTLQAVSAIGQSRLMRVYDRILGDLGLVSAQVLLAPLDFMHRSQYLHARRTLERLLDLGAVPVVNENDAIADDEIRFGDNDRLAALVAHLVNADLLVLLTDTPGLFTADPRLDTSASLVEEVVEVDEALLRAAGRSGTERGSGGMASKLAAARMAAWSGVPALIAGADRANVLVDAVHGVPGVGTFVRPHARTRKLTARKLWIAFAVGPAGKVLVDDGARRALVERNSSLLPAGVVGVVGRFGADDAVEIALPDGTVFAKGLARHSSTRVKEWQGRRTADLPQDEPPEIVHRDDLVVLPG
jgi:glutamate 5-kinase